MKFKLLPLLLLAGGSVFAQDYYGNRYDQRQDLRADHRDLSRDYAQLDRLRADVARDRYRLNAALARGDEWQARRVARDLARDQRALNALQADIYRDHRDIRHDRWQTNGNTWRYR